MLQFELTMDHQDIMNNQFDMKKYRRRAQNVVTAGGFVKSSQQMPVGLTNSVLKQNEEIVKQAASKLGARPKGAGQP